MMSIVNWLVLLDFSHFAVFLTEMQEEEEEEKLKKIPKCFNNKIYENHSNGWFF